MIVIQTAERDGALVQRYVTNTRALREALTDELADATDAVRRRVLGDALTNPDQTLRDIYVGAGRQLSVVKPAAAYRRSTTRSAAPALVETRTATLVPAAASPSIASDAPPAGRGFSGYATTWTPYEVTDSLGTFVETIRRGAFAESLAERTPIMQYDHGTHPLVGSLPLGRYRRIIEDDRGLLVVGELADSPLVEPIADALRDGRVTGMSIRFIVEAERWSPSKRNRDILRAQLLEAGPVVFPANPATSLQVRTKPRTRAQRLAAAAARLHPKATT